MTTPNSPIAQLSAALAGRYRIARELGLGGMATVYLADDLKQRRHVALKVLRPELATTLGADRFLAEIATTAAMPAVELVVVRDLDHRMVFTPRSSRVALGRGRVGWS